MTEGVVSRTVDVTPEGVVDRLWHEEIYQYEHEDVKFGEEAKSTLSCEGEENARKCEAKN